MIPKWIRIFLFSIIIFSFVALPVSHAKDADILIPEESQIVFTPAEQAWIGQHPDISIGIMNAWPPLNYVDEAGVPRGIGVDYLNAINKRLGSPLSVVPAPFKENLDAVKSKKLDALMDITPKPDREPFFNFTTPYLTIPQIIVGHKDKPYFSGEKDLYGKSIALESGYYTVKRFKRDHPEIQIREYTNTSDCLDAVSRGEADAYVGNRAVAIYLMEKELITNLRVMGRTSQPPVPLSIGIRKDWPELAEILNKALASLSPQEVQAIHRRWAKKTDLPTKALAFTPEEKAWLDKHPVVRARIGKAPPLHFFDGKSRGISVDYLNLIARRAGFTVQYVTDIPWSKALEDIKNHETIDLLLTAKVTPERRNHMAFTKDYLLMPWVIFTQKDSAIGSMEDLMDKTVAVERDYVMHKKLAAEYPDIKLLVKGTSQEAIEAVATGGADAYIGNLTTGVYIVRQNNLNNVKVVASTPFGNHDQAMAIRDDWPELAGIIDKGLAAISDKERNEILARYLGLLWPEGSKTAQTRVALTPEEQAWISKHRMLRIGADPAWPPYDFVDGAGEHRGVVADVFALLSTRLDLSFDLVPGLTWVEVLEAARERRLDIVSSVTVTPERAQYLKFSNPLTSTPGVIVTRKEFRSVKDLGDMTKDRVAMAKGYAIIELSRQAFPDLSIHTVESPLAGLEAVMSHQVDAYVGNLGVVSYLIQQNGLTNLRIAAAAGVKVPPFAIGVRSDWPELVRILNKGLESISPGEMSAIYKRWIPVEMGSIKPKGEIPISFGRLIGYGVVVLLISILLAWLIFKKSSRIDIAAGFGSARFRLMVLASLTFFMIIILLIGLFSLSRIKADILQDEEKNLRGTLLIAKKELGLWTAGRKAVMQHFGDEPKVVASTEQLLKAPPDRKALADSEALRKIRNYFKENKNIFPNIGFFIISPENISIGSTRNINLGTPNLISQQYPELIKRAFEGHIGFVPPMESDVQLEKASKPDAKQPSTMFFVGPIRKPDGKIIAVMTLVVDPSQDFSRTMTIVGVGGTEGTYAFTQGGRLISDIKFDEQLQQIGLIGEGEKAVLNIEIRDPGVNMVEGDRPLIERSRQPLTRMAAGAIALKSRMEAVGADYGHSEIEIDMAGYRDYRGVPVFGAWVWDANLKLGIATEIDVDEALSSYYRIRIIVLGVLGLTLVLFVGSTLFVLRMGERTHRALTRARDDLEDKVEERTTELREKQEQLSVAEERSHLLLDSAGEGILGVNSEGQCIFANPSALDMLGYTQDEIEGKNIHDLIHHTHADGSPYPGEDCPITRAYTHGETETISDEMLWRKDGIGFSVEYTATPMKKDGGLAGAVITFNDITERKRVQEDLRQNMEDLERFSKLAVGREERMINLKEEINELLQRSGQPDKYKIVT